MKKLVYILIGVLILTGASLYWLYGKYQKLSVEYSTSIENIKAYDAELSGLTNDTKVYKLTIEQLNYFNDSITKKMNEVRKELGIKDSKIKQMQYKLSHIEKSDSLTLPDTIFVNSFKLDTIMGDEWANNHIIMSYPNKIKITPRFKLESFLFVSAKKETIKPPKKFFLFRWFQKRHTVLNITVKENNPYAETDRQKFIEIIE
ncbi:lysis regulatory protein [uncultured phage cr126_1]|jgi:hypothetical protein|uniref:Lysis regulatory protein n=1 Tax=uncultured phage cr126_1 TaxID=2772075 RepID=A0A7M1S0F1_9CAUD|nr:lysis regulatory protein [uncultured phage cr126_1]QOR59621.1 lysis regulatory protein [uncultured phage cr126_1]DAG98278.1 MAG TPA: Lipopolysaccharide export system ATP-binding protein transport, ABC-transporter, LIPID TRANSPORT [Crassvirales sp.]